MQLETGESISYVIRKHWLVFSVQAVFLLLLALVPLIAASFLPQAFYADVATVPYVGDISAFLYVLWLLALWILAFVAWTNFFLDTWIVTNKRIIDINQRRLFHRDMTTLRIEKIQDISVDVSGLLATLFGIGTISLYTASENENIVIAHAADAEKAKAAIGALHLNGHKVT